MADLTKIKTQELEAEIERRKQSYAFTIQGRSFTLNLDEIIDLQKQLNKINPPENPLDIWREIHDEEVEKRRGRIWIQPPINIPNWPSCPKGPSDYPEPPKIWCYSKGNAPIWAGAATN